MASSTIPVEIHHHHTVVETSSTAPQLPLDTVLNEPSNLSSLRHALVGSLNLLEQSELELKPTPHQPITTAQAKEMGVKLVIHTSASITVNQLSQRLTDVTDRLAKVEAELSEEKRFRKKVAKVS